MAVVQYGPNYPFLNSLQEKVRRNTLTLPGGAYIISPFEGCDLIETGGLFECGAWYQFSIKN